VINSVKSPCDEGVLHSRPDTIQCKPHAEAWVLVATILGSSMAFIDSSAVNVALPVMQRELSATAADMQWVVEAYALFLSALILVGGSLGDHFGRRRIFALGISIFILASVWCGFSPTILQLIMARALQGVGGALLVPGSLAIISASFSTANRGRAIGTWSGFTSVTSVVGPVLGGWLVQFASWRWVFFLNVPLAITVLVILFWRVPESRDEHLREGLDWWGTALVTLGLGGVVFGLIEAGSLGLGHSLALLPLLGGLIALGAFIFVEVHSRAPMVPLTLFRSSDFSGTNLLTLLLYAALGATTYFLPFDLIQVQGYSATAAGTALMPFAFTMFLLSRWAGGLVRRFGAKLPLVAGPSITAASFVLFALAGRDGSYWLTIFPAVLVMSLGMTITVAPLTTTVMGSVSQDSVGTASGINNAVARTASLLAIAVLGIVVASVFGASLHSQLSQLNVSAGVRQQLLSQQGKLATIDLSAIGSPQLRAVLKGAIDAAFISGFRTIMFICAALALLSAAIALFMIGNTRKQAPQEAERTAVR
jgi:EmrB/QacA subfamily drug resistance transporter